MLIGTFELYDYLLQPATQVIIIDEIARFFLDLDGYTVPEKAFNQDYDLNVSEPDIQTPQPIVQPS